MFLFFIVGLYIVFNIYPRYYYQGEGENRQLYQALHIALPGYAEVLHLEQEVDLREWAGSRYDGLAAVNRSDGSENPEATAGIALLAAGVYSGYQLKEKDGHYILHRPEETERFFTLKAWYRLGKGKRVED